jgi:hypothetical protein
MRVGGNIPLLRAERWRFAARAAATASAHSEETRRRAEHTVRLLYAGTEVSAEERGITNATRFFAAARIVADGALQRTVAQALQEALEVGHRGRIAREAAISRGAEPQRTACAVDQDTSATAAVLAGVARASASTPQPRPVPQGPHEPPQSMAVSSPLQAWRRRSVCLSTV